MIFDKNQDIIRCQKCNLIPLINFYFSTNDIKLLLKCRNNHEFEKDLYNYLDNNLSPLKNNTEDAKCHLHNEKITMICQKCNKNLCKKCSITECDEAISIEKYSPSKADKEKIENNIIKFEPFIDEIQKKVDKAVGTYSQKREFLASYLKEFLKVNNYLIKLAKIIYFTFIHNENNLSFEIIQNCKHNLNFNYNELSINNYTKDNPDESLGPSVEGILRLLEPERLYYNIIYNYLEKKANYILQPYKEEIDKSKITSFDDMEFICEHYEDWCYSTFAELSDGRLALSDETKIDIFKLNSLELDFTISPPPKENKNKDNKDSKKEEEEEGKKDEDDIRFFFGEMIGLSDGNLMVITDDYNLTIYKIEGKNYAIIDTIKHKEKLFKITELHDNTILLFKSNTIIQYKLIDGKYKEINKIKNELIPEKGSGKSILKEFKDYSKILLYSDSKLVYFNMKGEFELKAEFKYGYGMLWDFLGNDYLLQGKGDIYIKDINTLKEIAYKECGEKFDYEVECLCSLKDNSFLCGLSNRFGCILKQYVFKGKTIEEVASKSFESYKQDFNNIYQLKNGNIIGTISSGDYFLFLKN